MHEFVTSYPLFSYIAVPVLFFLLLGLIAFVLRPKNVEWDYFSGLYNACLDAIDYIDSQSNSFKKEKLKTLAKMLAKLKHYYEMLESEELYEVEDIIINIKKAISITRALIVARSNEGEIADYLTDILDQLKIVRKTLYGFNLSRAKPEHADFAPLPNINRKKSKQKADEYLKNIKHES